MRKQFNTDLEHPFRNFWSSEDVEVIIQTRDISTQSTSRSMAVIDAVSHVKRHNLQGVFVECGVYMGVTPVLLAHALHKFNYQRDVWLYDTFEGIVGDEITDVDYNTHTNEHARDFYDNKNGRWCYCDVPTVKQNISKFTDYDHFYYIKGRVSDTIPDQLPSSISYLRLDMDLALPTEHALKHMWPLLELHGIMHVDDYNYFKGVKDVVDNYLSDKKFYIHEIDYSAVSIVKL
jgi:O-methyltransferase